MQSAHALMQLQGSLVYFVVIPSIHLLILSMSSVLQRLRGRRQRKVQVAYYLINI